MLLWEKLKNTINRPFDKIKTKSFDEYYIKIVLIDIREFLREETYQKYYGDKESMVLVSIVPNFLSPESKYKFSSARNKHFQHTYGGHQ